MNFVILVATFENSRPDRVGKLGYDVFDASCTSGDLGPRLGTRRHSLHRGARIAGILASSRAPRRNDAVEKAVVGEITSKYPNGRDELTHCVHESSDVRVKLIFDPR